MSKITITIADGKDISDTRPDPKLNDIEIASGEDGVSVRVAGDIWARYRAVGEPRMVDGKMQKDTERVLGMTEVLALHLAKIAHAEIANRDDPSSIFSACNEEVQHNEKGDHKSFWKLYHPAEDTAKPDEEISSETSLDYELEYLPGMVFGIDQPHIALVLETSRQRIAGILSCEIVETTAAEEERRGCTTLRILCEVPSTYEAAHDRLAKQCETRERERQRQEQIEAGKTNEGVSIEEAGPDEVAAMGRDVVCQQLQNKGFIEAAALEIAGHKYPPSTVNDILTEYGRIVAKRNAEQEGRYRGDPKGGQDAKANG